MSTLASSRSEHVEQREFVSWFRKRYSTLIMAIPNGEQRSQSVARRLKVEGVLAGVPDLYVPEYNLWIEMKRENGGQVSRSQTDVMDEMKSYGHTCRVAHGAGQARAIAIEVIEGL